MVKRYLHIILIFYFCNASAQAPLIKQWDYSYGGFDSEFLGKIVPLSDGGFLATGESLSDIGVDKSEDNWDTQSVFNTYDFWIIKCDADGIPLWDKTLGGSNDDFLYDVVETADGGIICIGRTRSPLSGTITQAQKGVFDIWLTKLSSTGVILWDKRFGGNGNSGASSILELPDGFLIAGYTDALQGVDVSANGYGSYDYWIIRTDTVGNKLWDKKYGGSDSESMSAILRNGNNFVLAGISLSSVSGIKTQPNYVAGMADAWLVEIDSAGNYISDKVIGSLDTDYALHAMNTSDGNFLLSMITTANAGGDKTLNSYGVEDFWMVKVDPQLNIIWDQTIGGDSDDGDGAGIFQSQDGGYMVSGTSYSSPNLWKSQLNVGPENVWAVKVDTGGNKVWDRTIITGYAHEEYGAVTQLNDGCILIGGNGDAIVGGDVTDDGYSFDYWIIKLCDTTAVATVPCSFQVNAGSDITLCNNASTQLNGATSLLTSQIANIEWLPAAGLNNPSVLTPLVQPDSSMQYILSVTATGASELVFNGNFSAGDTGFTTSYIPGTGGISGIISNEGEYTVNTNPHAVHIDFATYGDHTTGNGNMLLLNGSANFNMPLWCQTVNVAPNSVYNFSAWARTANWQNPAMLEVTINGTAIGPVYYLTADTGTWYQLSYTWNSATASTADICITDLSTWSAGNDFAIDDISFTGSCTVTDTVVVAISSASVNLGSDTTVCDGNTVLLSSSTPYMQNNWYYNNTLIASSQDTLSASQEGTYILSITDTLGCNASDSVTVNFYNLPLVETINDITICRSDTVFLFVTGAENYIWIPGIYLSTDTGSLSFSIPLNSVAYIVTGTDNNGCSSTDTVTITVSDAPVSEFNYAIDVTCDGVVLRTDNLSSNADDYLWSFGDGTSSTENNPQHIYNGSGLYEVVLTASVPGCSDTTGRYIEIPEAISIDSVANVFTPNGDGVNDCFELSIQPEYVNCYEMKIMNRWGQTVFNKDRNAACWNGRNNNTGKEEPEGTYFYLLDFGKQTFRGAVQLSR